MDLPFILFYIFILLFVTGIIVVTFRRMRSVRRVLLDIAAAIGATSVRRPFVSVLPSVKGIAGGYTFTFSYVPAQKAAPPAIRTTVLVRGTGRLIIQRRGGWFSKPLFAPAEVAVNDPAVASTLQLFSDPDVLAHRFLQQRDAVDFAARHLAGRRDRIDVRPNRLRVHRVLERGQAFLRWEEEMEKVREAGREQWDVAMAVVRALSLPPGQSS